MWASRRRPPRRRSTYRDYRTYRYFEGFDRSDRSRRGELRDRLFHDADRVRQADSNGRINHATARRLYNRLDDVRDFLRDDRHLTSSEFDRRWDDLRDVERDLRGSRSGHRHYNR